MDEDYYKVLGLSRGASPADIQKAYRDLARKHHPDMNPDDKSAKEKFQKVQKAYEVLNDSEKREMYDRYGSSFDSMGGGPGGGFQPGPGGAQDIDFSQFFGQRFGGDPLQSGGGYEDIFKHFASAGGGPRQARQRRRAPKRGANLKHGLEISFNTSIEGGEARLSVRRPNGKVESISLKIPAGIEHGKKIRLSGQGEPSAEGGKAGDILITVRVAAHPFFRRRGKNLEVQVPVTLTEAALGSKIDIPTPRGVISLTIPPGSSSGKRLRLKGLGVSPSGEEPGDLFAEIQIVLPDKLDEESAEWIRQIDKKHPSNPRDELKW